MNRMGPNDLLVLTWDEDDNGNNHILTVFVGAPVKQGYVSTGTVNHYTLLRTLCDGLGLAPFGAAASQNPIADVWAGPPQPAFCPFFTGPTPADGAGFDVNAGDRVSFSVAAQDSNLGDRVTLVV